VSALKEKPEGGLGVAHLMIFKDCMPSHHYHFLTSLSPQEYKRTFIYAPLGDVWLDGCSGGGTTGM